MIILNTVNVLLKIFSYINKSKGFNGLIEYFLFGFKLSL